MPVKVESSPVLPGLSPVRGRSIVARFDGACMSSDGGLLALREGLCCKLLPRCAKAAINGSDDLSGRFEFELLAEKLDCLSQS